MIINVPLKLRHLPNSLPLEGAVRIELYHVRSITNKSWKTPPP